jgi:hypothetical protein
MELVMRFEFHVIFLEDSLPIDPYFYIFICVSLVSFDLRLFSFFLISSAEVVID